MLFTHLIHFLQNLTACVLLERLYNWLVASHCVNLADGMTEVMFCQHCIPAAGTPILADFNFELLFLPVHSVFCNYLAGQRVYLLSEPGGPIWSLSPPLVSGH